LSNEESWDIEGNMTPIPMPRVVIECQDQFGRWHHYQTMHNEANAFRSAQNRARTTGKRHRLADERSRLLDLIDP
jgi:hypothetical protein